MRVPKSDAALRKRKMQYTCMTFGTQDKRMWLRAHHMELIAATREGGLLCFV